LTDPLTRTVSFDWTMRECERFCAPSSRIVASLPGRRFTPVKECVVAPARAGSNEAEAGSLECVVLPSVISIKPAGEAASRAVPPLPQMASCPVAWLKLTGKVALAPGTALPDVSAVMNASPAVLAEVGTLVDKKLLPFVTAPGDGAAKPAGFAISTFAPGLPSA